MNSKILKFALGLAAFAMLAPTAIAVQRAPADRDVPGEKPVQNAFCLRFNNAYGRVQQLLEKRRERITERKEERHNQFEQRREERNERIRERRETAENRVDDYFDALRNRAQNEGQKQAVENFVDMVHQAIQTRKAAIDAAVETFRNGVDSLAQKRQQEAETAMNNFRTATQATIDKAKAACAAGEDAESIKQTFLSEMEAAKQALKEAGKNLEDDKAELEALRKTRNDTLRTAQEAFRQTMEQARIQLKAALGTTTE